MLQSKTKVLMMAMLSFLMLGVFTACNDASKTEKSTDNSVTVKKDTANVIDTTVAPRPLKPGN